MGFSSQDDLINKITNLGQRLRIENFKSTSPGHTAGGWHLLAGNAGSPNAGTFPGTDLLFQSCWETTGDGTTVIGMQHGGIVTPATKHVSAVSAMVVAAAGAPWQAKLVDLQGYYRLSGANVTGTGSRTLINSNTFTASSSSGLLLTYTNDFNNLTKVRFTNSGGALPTGLTAGVDYYLVRVSATTARVATSLANAIAGTTIAFTDAGTGTHTMTIQMRANSGVGVEAFFVVQTAPATGGPNLTASNYRNQAGTDTRAFQGTPSFGAAADAYATRVLHSGVAAARYGAFLPKQAADTGIQLINSFTLSGGTPYTGTGILAVCLAKPVGVDLILPASGVFTERDLINQLPSLPQVDDGACLVWMLFGTGATTNLSPFTSYVDVVWG